MSFASNTPIQFIPGIGNRTAEVMHTLGIHTAGHLYRMPEGVLIELFGPSIRSVLDTMTRFTTTRSTTSRKMVTTRTYTSTITKQPFWKRLQLAAQFLSVL